MNKSVLTLRNLAEPRESFTCLVSPADPSDISSPVLVKFDDHAGTFELRTIQFGSRITPRLDAPARRHDAGSLVAAVSGQ
jgi:hypothetical protein